MNRNDRDDQAHSARAALIALLEEVTKLCASDAAGLIRGARLGHLERHYLGAAVRACDGNISAASALLGINRRTLQRNLKPHKTRARKPKRKASGKKKKR